VCYLKFFLPKQTFRSRAHLTIPRARPTSKHPDVNYTPPRSLLRDGSRSLISLPSCRVRSPWGKIRLQRCSFAKIVINDASQPHENRKWVSRDVVPSPCAAAVRTNENRAISSIPKELGRSTPGICRTTVEASGRTNNRFVGFQVVPWCLRGYAEEEAGDSRKSRSTNKGFWTPFSPLQQQLARSSSNRHHHCLHAAHL